MTPVEEPVVGSGRPSECRRRAARPPLLPAAAWCEVRRRWERLQAGKRTWVGHLQRRVLLERAGIVVPADLGAAGRMAGVDDVLDAAVAAWSAQRIAAGIARSLPDPPERDTEGRAVAIWY
jgi:Protein of unknown function (DUF429)